MDYKGSYRSRSITLLIDFFWFFALLIEEHLGLEAQCELTYVDVQNSATISRVPLDRRNLYWPKRESSLQCILRLKSSSVLFRYCMRCGARFVCVSKTFLLQTINITIRRYFGTFLVQLEGCLNLSTCSSTIHTEGSLDAFP